MAKKVPNINAVKVEYELCDEGIKEYFSELPRLLDSSFSLETIIAYCFLKVEQALHRTLYGGLVKLHKVDTSLARAKVEKLHLTRDSFQVLYKNIYSNKVPLVVQDKIKVAETIRDRVMHGKDVNDNEIREAIVDIIKYSSDLNNEVKSRGKFKPFGSMKGFAGQYTPLNKQTTAWLLKGILYVEKKK